MTLMTLGECKNEVLSIIRELRDIEQGVRSDFDGIGEQICADYIETIAQKYEDISRKLDGVNYNSVATWINPNLT